MLSDFKDKHKGERCFILGNGPSLNDVDFDLLEGEVTFGTNGIFKNDWNFLPTYYASVNPLVIEQFAKEIMEINTTRFLPFTPNAPELSGETHYIDNTLRKPEFRSEPPYWEGYTVTFVCLQLAYYMGFTEVILLGVDHYFGNVTEPNKEVIAAGADEWHFRPDYFSNGTRWNLPDLKMSELAYSLARKAYEVDERKIYNCSSKTQLDVFEKRTLNHVLNPTKVSAIVSAYYAEHYIEGCLKDLFEQTLTPEVIVVCQRGSKEHRVAEKWNAKLVLTDDIPTIYKAWNLGIEAAGGEYITNANTDDRHREDAYELMASVLDANKHIDLVYHDCYVNWGVKSWEEFVRDNNGSELFMGRQPDQPGVYFWPEYSRVDLANGCYIGPQPMWRANLHQKYGGFDEEMESAGDFEFWLRAAREDNMYHIPLPLGVYCAREDGKELSDLELSVRESSEALMRGSEDGIEIRNVNPVLARISLGSSWIFFEKDKLKEMVMRL